MRNLSSPPPKLGGGPRVAVFLFVFLLLPLSAQAANPLDYNPPTTRQGNYLSVVINEIAWMGTTNSANNEWIELYNNTGVEISLDGWGLYEGGGKTLVEPLAGIIGAESYYLIERTDDETVPNIEASQPPTGWGGYGLSNDGEYLQLLNNNSNVIDEINCGDGWVAGIGKPGYKTMERINVLISGNDSGNWQTSQNPGGTPKEKNSIAIALDVEVKLLQEEMAPESPVKADESKPIIYPLGIVINEILPSPEGPDEKEEWIEIFNQNNFEVDLSDWQITDTVGKTNIYTFSAGTKIFPQGFLVLPRPVTKITLNNDSDGLNLVQPDGKIMDNLSYEKAQKGKSFNRLGSEWLWGPDLTPGAINIISSTSLEVKKNQSTTTQKEVKENSEKRALAAISEQIPKQSSDSFFLFFIAFTIALFSGLIILVLKRKLKIS